MKTWLLALKKSLAARLLIMFVMASVLITGLILTALALGLSSQWRQDVRPHLLQYLSYVHRDIGYPPNIARAEALTDRLPINIYIQGGELDFSSTGKPLDFDRLDFYEPGDRPQLASRYFSGSPRNIDGTISIGEYRDRVVLRNIRGDYQIYYELSYRNRVRHSDEVAAIAIFCLLAILGLSYFLLRYLLRPVQDIKAGASRMGEGDLDYRVPVRAENDLGDLARSINQMAEDIEAMLNAKRQLLLGVSHELRSPLTRAKIATEMLEDSANKQRIQEDIDEMERMIAEILEAERMKSNHAALQRRKSDLNKLVHSVLDEIQGGGRVTFTELEDNTPVYLDDARIRLLLRNLVMNALTHSSESHTPPEIVLTRSKGEVIIVVKDYGNGVSADHLARLTEPFYRVDPSRTRATGGVGIGLYLCKLIAEAHDGELVISSEPGKGLRAEVRLPEH